METSVLVAEFVVMKVVVETYVYEDYMSIIQNTSKPELTFKKV